MPCVTLSSGKTVCFDNNNSYSIGGEVNPLMEGDPKTGTKATPPATPKNTPMVTGFTSEQLAGLATQIFSSDPNLMGGDIPAAIGNRRLTDNERVILRAAIQELNKAYQQGPIRPITPQRIDELRSTLTPLKPLEPASQFAPGGEVDLHLNKPSKPVEKDIDLSGRLQGNLFQNVGATGQLKYGPLNLSGEAMLSGYDKGVNPRLSTNLNTSVQVNPKLNIQGGLNYDYSKRDGSQFVPTIGANYQANPNLNISGSFTPGSNNASLSIKRTFNPGGKTLQVQGSNFNFPVSRDRQLAEQARMQGDMPVAPGVVKAQQAIKMEDAAQKKLGSTPLKLTPSQQKAIEDSYREKGLTIPTALEALQDMDKRDLLSNPDDTTYLDELGQVGSDLVNDVSENGVLGLVRAPIAGLTGLVSGRYELPQQAIGRWALRNDHHMTRNAMIDDEGNPTALSMAPFAAGAIAAAPAAAGALGSVGVPVEVAEGLELANAGYKTFQKGKKGVNALTNALEGNYAGAAGDLISLVADLAPSGKLSAGDKFKLDAISGGLSGFGNTGDLAGAARGAFDRSLVKKAAGNLTGGKDTFVSNLVKGDLRAKEAALDPTNKIASGLLSRGDNNRSLVNADIMESTVDSNTPYIPNPNTVLAQLPPKKKKGGKVKKQLIAVKNKNKK